MNSPAVSRKKIIIKRSEDLLLEASLKSQDPNVDREIVRRLTIESAMLAVDADDVVAAKDRMSMLWKLHDIKEPKLGSTYDRKGDHSRNKIYGDMKMESGREVFSHRTQGDKGAFLDNQRRLFAESVDPSKIAVSSTLESILQDLKNSLGPD